VFWLLEARKPPKMYGKMSEAEVKAIYEEDFGPVEDD
jgi:hypothetical protein